MAAPKQQYVYFLKPKGEDGPIKIGWSTIPEGRLMELSVWSPVPLELIGKVPGSFKDEQFLHRCFLHLHSHREWFFGSRELRDAIAEILKANSVEVVRDTLTPRDPKARKKRAPSTPETRLRMKYGARIRHAELRRRNTNIADWRAPDDVTSIMYRWQGAAVWGVPRQPPTEAQMARLDEYLANPAGHSVIPSWKRLKDPICIPVFVAEGAQ